jgi:hypothetical protein
MTIVADQVHTSLRSNVPVSIIILPRCIGKQAIFPDGTNIAVVLDNVLVISTAELWSIDRHHPPIKICDALKPKSRIPLFPFCTVMIASGTIRPLHMNHIHGTNTTWQSCGIVVPICAF